MNKDFGLVVFLIALSFVIGLAIGNEIGKQDACKPIYPQPEPIPVKPNPSPLPVDPPIDPKPPV